MTGINEMDALLTKYAEKADEIYQNRTAGDFTWVGLLAGFAHEVISLTNAEK